MNTEPTKLYIVLSVREIKRLLKEATKSRDAARAKSDRKKNNHCVVLDLLTCPDVPTGKDGAVQVSSASFSKSVSDINS